MSRNRRSKGKLDLSSPVDDFGSSPFESLHSENLPESTGSELPVAGFKALKEVKRQDQLGKGERLDVRREKSGRGGKTVTTVAGFSNRINAPARAKLLKGMKKKLGTGGSWVGDCMELQGDKRKEVVSWLTALGFKPVLAGG